MMAGMSSTLPDELRALLGELISDIGERVYLRSEAEGARQRHDVSVISAPVYDHHHRQAMGEVDAHRKIVDGQRDRGAGTAMPRDGGCGHRSRRARNLVRNMLGLTENHEQCRSAPQ